MSLFNCEIRLTFSGNETEAKSVEDFITKTIDRFWEEHGIMIDESEIHDIQEINP